MIMKSSKCSTQGSSIIGSADLYMPTLNSHWLDEKEEGRVITCKLLSIAVTEGFSALKRSNLTNDNSDACGEETSFLCRTGI